MLSPESTVGRGYSITTDEAGKVIRSISAVTPTMKVRTRVSDGEFRSEVS